MTQESTAASASTIAAWVLTGIALVLILWLHLTAALLAGLLVYELVDLMKPAIKRRTTDRRKTFIAVTALAGIVVTLMAAAIIGAIAFFNSDAGSVPALLAKMADILSSSRAMMPEWLARELPVNPEDLKEAAGQWMRDHLDTVQLAGVEALRELVYVLLGLVLGALIALNAALPEEPQGVLATALLGRIVKLGTAFRRVVFAQVRIALLNTLFTGVYLTLVLPLFGVDLPLKKTLIAVTFIAGLLPVLGNLISNTAIVIVSLSYSPQAAIASLLFLVTIHKLEYFLNARIVGRRIESRAWELLVAMLVMEAAFGVHGLIAAPIFYAYLKDELTERGVI
jgi:predicted PurR-regulated permease PerM